jgi:DNA-binding transcriptional MocR family regulator
MTQIMTNGRAKSAYELLKTRNFALDMTRGNPCKKQLALSDKIRERGFIETSGGIDCRNYGRLEGLPEMREWFGKYFDMPPGNVLALGNSSLALMHDVLLQSLVRGVSDGRSWHLPNLPPKFLCPVPGYDRHFNICELYGIAMQPVKLREDGPDMDEVEEAVRKDPSIVGIWCVPKYSNPKGTTYSKQAVHRLAKMETANPAFRIFWDNAYAVHDLTDEPPQLENIFRVCKAHGNPDRVFVFGSTSKITFAGAGVAAFAASERNVKWFLQGLRVQTIGPDKLNQLQHVRFLPTMGLVRRHMKLHREILAPKFAAVMQTLDQYLGHSEIATWTNPRGGYFVSFDVKPGCAKRVVELADQAGVKLTPAGATFPYRKDPLDSNIRIAPSFPGEDEIRKAMEVLAISTLVAVAEKS